MTHNNILLVSFGYNLSGSPDGYTIFDARGIQNPMRKFAGTRKTGLDKEVREYVIGTSKQAKRLVDDVVNEALRGLKEGYGQSGAVFIAVGCSWGHHRSVSVVEEAALRLKKLGHKAEVRHLELEDNERYDIDKLSDKRRENLRMMVREAEDQGLYELPEIILK